MRLRRLLGLLGSEHDGEVLNAARLAHAMIRGANTTWEAVIPESDGSVTESGAGNRAGDRLADLDKLDQMLASSKVADVLKLRLADMRRALLRDRLADADRRMLRILYRKAIVDGVIVES